MDGRLFLCASHTHRIHTYYTQYYDFIKQHKQAKNNKDSKRKTISLSALLFPTYIPPGAVLVLVLSYTLNAIPLDFFRLSMSLVSIPIIASAYFAWAGREGLFIFSSQNKVLSDSFLLLQKCWDTLYFLSFLYILHGLLFSD